MCGPITSADDVKWSLGNTILLDPEHAKENFDQIVSAAKEAMEMVYLQLKLKYLMDSGMAASYFSEHLRHDIRKTIDEIDKISAGPRMAVDRSFSSPVFANGPGDDGMSGQQSCSGISGHIQPPELSEDAGESFPPDVFRNQSVV